MARSGLFKRDRIFVHLSSDTFPFWKFLHLPLEHVLTVIQQRSFLFLYSFEWLFAISRAKLHRGRLFPGGKKLKMNWVFSHTSPGALFTRFILRCPVKNSSLCSSGLLQELSKSSSLQTLQKHLSPLMMWSTWLILEKWKRKGTGIHSCSVPWAAESCCKVGEPVWTQIQSDGWELYPYRS